MFMAVMLRSVLLALLVAAHAHAGGVDDANASPSGRVDDDHRRLSRRRRNRNVIVPSNGAPYLEVDYGDRHPFEVKARARAEGDHRRLQFTSDDDYEPIRITVAEGRTFDPPTNKIRSFILDELVPAVLELWTSAVRTFPVAGDLRAGFETNLCSGSGFFSNTDLVVFLGTNAESLCDVFVESEEPFAFVCQKDTYGRPTVGNLEICTDFLDLDSTESKADAIAAANRNMGHILGFVSTSFADYHDRYTGLPRTPDKVETTVECIDGVTSTIVMPSEDVIKKITTDEETGSTQFALVTPAVVNTVRNQFNCPTMAGAPLEDIALFTDECLGSNWETRLFPTELMVGTSFYDTDFGGFIPKLSPITLAALEDSGWYVVNYSAVQSSASMFGFGRGCDFVEQPCVVDGQVPAYSEGFFCAEAVTDFPAAAGCTPDRLKVAGCLVFDQGFKLPPSQRYFPDFPSWGGSDLTDFCPIWDGTGLFLEDEEGEEFFVDFNCADRSIPENFPTVVLSKIETFSKNARCVESTNLQRPVCLKHKCNAETGKVEFVVNKKTFVCDNAGDTFRAAGGEYICPNVREICPEFVCPNLCSGRGECDFETGTCTCIDPEDTSPSCANTALGEYPIPPPPCPAWTFQVGDAINDDGTRNCQAHCRERDGLQLDAATGSCQPICDATQGLAYNRAKEKCISNDDCGLGTVFVKGKCPKVCKKTTGLAVNAETNSCDILCDANLGLTFDADTQTCVSAMTCPEGYVWTGSTCVEACSASQGLAPTKGDARRCALLCDPNDDSFFHARKQACVTRTGDKACDPGQFLRSNTKCSAICSRNSGLMFNEKSTRCVPICNERGTIYNSETEECQVSI